MEICYIILLLIFIIFILYNNYEYLDICTIDKCNNNYILSDNKCIKNDFIYKFTTCGSSGNLGPTLD